MTKRTAVILFSLAVALSTRAATTLRVMKQGLGFGVVTSVTPGINCPSDCSESYTTPDMVELRVTQVPSGSAFDGWGGDCTGMGTCFVTMDVDRAVHVKFKPSPDLVRI